MTNVVLLGQPSLGGLQGPSGADGLDGASAYEIAVANGFQGTVTEWLASLGMQPCFMALAKSGQTFPGFLECDGSTYDEALYPSLVAAGYVEVGGAVDVIDLGVDGNLILPVKIGSETFYYWDLNGSGVPGDNDGSIDLQTLGGLKTRFNGGANFSEIEPQININGVDIVLPELGVPSPSDGGYLTSGYSSGLASIWETFNGAPAGWPSSYYCSSSPFSTTGAWRLAFSGQTFGTSTVTQNSHVAVRVPNPPQVTNYALPDSATDLGAPVGFSYYIKY